MIKKIVKKVVNIPIIWNTAQNIVGANPWKNRLYPSVFKKKGTMLDFGCSIGNNTEAFLDFEYYGVDLDPEVIRAAKERWKEYKNVQFYEFDILKSEFKKDFFDHVLFACTGHHLKDEEIQPILDALLRTLKPDGVLHFFDVIRQPEKDGFTTRLIMNNDQGKNMRTLDEYKNIFDPKKYNIVELKLFPSPDRMIKLQDMLYIRAEKQ